MFNLETAIVEWRKQMLAAGIKTPVPMEELELHLRDDIESQVKSGLGTQRAFEVAVRQIGPDHLLENEFKKLEGKVAARKEKEMRIFCAVFLVIYSWMCFYGLLKAEMSESQGIFGLIAVALADIFIWYAPYFHRHLPVIQHKRATLTIRIIPMIAWMICAGFFMNFALQRLDLTQSQLEVIMLWLMLPWAIFGSIGYGLEGAARANIATANS